MKTVVLSQSFDLKSDMTAGKLATANMLAT